MNAPFRRGASALAAALLITAMVAALAPRPASAESALWSLTASPLAVSTGVATTFSLTATNEDPLEPLDSSREIGCLWVDVPDNFIVSGAAVTGSNTGDRWRAAVSGNRITVWTTSGGDRLALFDWVRFSIRATAISAGALAWNARAYRDEDCGGTGALLGVPPVVVVSGADVTPTPTPTASPTPTPTPSPRPTPTASPTPTPLLPLPTVSLTPLPTLDLLETPTPTPSPQASTTPEAEESSGPTSSVTPAPSESSDGSPSPSPPPGSEGAGPSPGAVGSEGGSVGPSDPTTIGRVAHQPRQANLGIGGLGVLDGAAVWFVPAAVLGVPGALIVLLVVLQVLGGAVWLPVVRRSLGDQEQGPRYRFRG